MVNDKTDKFNRLRTEYPEFIYNDYEYVVNEASVDIAFNFEIPGLSQFNPRWSIKKPENRRTDPGDLELLIFNLGMVELISYWKLTCSPKIIIRCGYLSPDQIKWWKKLFVKGLGEFFYTNGITFDNDQFDILCDDTIRNKTHVKHPVTVSGNTLPRVLIPVGGGKDSAVTINLLENKAERFGYVINPRKACTDTLNASSIPSDNYIFAYRTLDKNMLRLNAEGFLNGHTPFSALVAFSSILTAYINDIPYVALSNESSANEATVLNSDVNHQYSKSFEFEADFVNYEKEYIGSGVSYFSLLRPFAEVKIAKLFSGFKEYHEIFRSCNAGSKSDIWCNRCAKCLFVYIILAPFLDERDMLRIFGENLLDKYELKPIFDKLIGIMPEKPFECVGSYNEVNAALQRLLDQYAKKGLSLPVLLKYYGELDHIPKYSLEEFCESFDNNNLIPEYFLNLLIDMEIKQ